MFTRLVRAEIDTSAYRQNITHIRNFLSPHTKLMSVIKANAYGHGAVEIAQCAQAYGVDYLGVVCLYEAQQLRNAGITLPILILNYIDPQAAVEAIKLHCAITIMDTDVLNAVVSYAKETGSKPTVHIKVDTGMHRAGVPLTQAEEYIRLVASYPGLNLEGIFTHFATADDPDLSFTQTQCTRFTQLIAQIRAAGITPSLIHAANSAATLRLPSSHFSMVRPGIITYGLHPFGVNSPQAFSLPFTPKPVMRLVTQIATLRTIHKGEGVGYGQTYIASKETTVALIPVGYADGFRRGPNNFGEVLLHGQRVPLLGRVSMDQSSIDVSAIDNVRVGDEVVLIGKQGNQQISAEEIADKLGTISYEVVSSIAARVQRIVF